MKYPDSPDDWYAYDGTDNPPTRRDGTPLRTLLETTDVRLAVPESLQGPAEAGYIIEVGIIHDDETSTSVLVAPAGYGGISMTPAEARDFARTLTLCAERAEGLAFPEAAR